MCRRDHWPSQVKRKAPILSITFALNSPTYLPFSPPSRSLVTALRAAEKFEQKHLSTPSVARLIDGAKFFYVEGYFLTHGLDSALEIAKKASDSGRVTFVPLHRVPHHCSNVPPPPSPTGFRP